ncbi:nudix hydrolase 12, mitochondrial-like protein [Cinnamomum micranthum f. kanehirae]|uniref:Nudix hydrolase 12, mitochondrial-like protein n=1 Tax=Cinnamomum micranthum f. kanehirae TaxID=337451 RepID=A0A3S3QMV9_9MAGN|nr:nudix hydrolase 12, mitochondrial-like protein [Cinnamomum micranthum f. kanehirae]
MEKMLKMGFVTKNTMSDLLARTGRERQRYDEDNFRLVAGCIPYRLKENVDDPTGNIQSRLEVLMISTPNRSDLVFPKENQLGVWEFRSKSRQNSCSSEGSCRGYMFALEVTEEVESWPEQATHGRIWLSVGEAFELCRYDWMRGALQRFLRVLSEDNRKYWMMEDTMTLAASTVPEIHHMNLSTTPNTSSTNTIKALC